ncbi:TadE family type IV pilus minor pilin [Streptomyces sp. ME08-AFT2]|nr:TadE family type IV pilus minor pilin [Streptomyces sp. ME08-AFT2]MDX3314583.1 TadE family type IV pilus minor pilin [Streptomyces sp. ME08-AFT2]
MTAESAVVLPVLVVFAMSLVWGLLVMAAQIQCVDAARAGARAAARQDPAGSVLEVARATAPRGARVTIGREGDQVRVVVAAKPPGLRGLPFEVREEAVAAAEEAVGDPGSPEDLGTPGTEGTEGTPGGAGGAVDAPGVAPGAEAGS